MLEEGGAQVWVRLASASYDRTVRVWDVGRQAGGEGGCHALGGAGGGGREVRARNVASFFPLRFSSSFFVKTRVRDA